MDLVPTEVLEIILKKISSVKDIINCSKTCIKWKNLIVVMFKDKGKFVIISNEGHEIVDLFNPNSKYELLVGNIPRVRGAMGSLFQKSPIICGGQYVYDYGYGSETTQNCVVIGQPKVKMNMRVKRCYASSVALNQNKIWIVGGKPFSKGGKSSTEFIKLGQPSVKGPDMPFEIYGHSMIQNDENSIYIIGGKQSYYDSDNFWMLSDSKKVWIVDPTNGFQIKEGPSLNAKRCGHGCAKMTTNGKAILVVAGGGNVDSEYLDTVEIFDPSTSNSKWTPGPNIPLKLEGLALITSPTGKGVIAMGGEKESCENSKAMFELSDSMEWTRLEQTLQIDHYYPLAIPTPDELVSNQD